jgi:hypothetical protein
VSARQLLYVPHVDKDLEYLGVLAHVAATARVMQLAVPVPASTSVVWVHLDKKRDEFAAAPAETRATW